MKYSTVAVAAAYFASQVAAFPAIADEIARAENEINDNVKRQGAPDPGLGRFNAKLQYVSNKGAHKFVAPNLATDARGPCPGLNAMANHGYLPHNGVGTHTDFIFGTNKGMSHELVHQRRTNFFHSLRYGTRLVWLLDHSGRYHRR